MIEKYSLEKAAEGYARTNDGRRGSIPRSVDARIKTFVRGARSMARANQQRQGLLRTFEAEFIDSENLDLGFQGLARQPEFRGGALAAADSSCGLR